MTHSVSARAPSSSASPPSAFCSQALASGQRQPVSTAPSFCRDRSRSRRITRSSSTPKAASSRPFWWPRAMRSPPVRSCSASTTAPWAAEREALQSTLHDLAARRARLEAELTTLPPRAFPHPCPPPSPPIISTCSSCAVPSILRSLAATDRQLAATTAQLAGTARRPPRSPARARSSPSSFLPRKPFSTRASPTAPGCSRWNARPRACR